MIIPIWNMANRAEPYYMSLHANRMKPREEGVFPEDQGKKESDKADSEWKPKDLKICRNLLISSSLIGKIMLCLEDLFCNLIGPLWSDQVTAIFSV